MDTTLKLYQFDGQEDVPFPYNGGGYIGEQAELLDFTVNKTRMGAAPTITGTLEYPVCLDSVWEAIGHFDDVFVVFNGEKYYLKATPASSKSNDKLFYKHELTFVSERAVLETVYMIDDLENRTPNILLSNNTQITFFGNINEFVERINQSMYFSGIGDTCVYDTTTTPPTINPLPRTPNGDGYYVVVDSSVTITDEVLVTLNNNTIFDALKQIFEKYGVPFYFVGKIIHIGNYEAVTETTPTYTDSDGVLGAGLSSGALVPYEYGQPNSVLTVNRNNGTKQIYNRCSGTGSEDNIPYYYPNNSPSGDISISASQNNYGDAVIAIQNPRIFAEKVQLNSFIQCANDRISPVNIISSMYAVYWNEDPHEQFFSPNYVTLPHTFDTATQHNGDLKTNEKYIKFKIVFSGSGFFNLRPEVRIADPDYYNLTYYILPNTNITSVFVYRGQNVETDPELEYGQGMLQQGDTLYFNAPSSGYHTLVITYRIGNDSISAEELFDLYSGQGGRVRVSLDANFGVSGYQFFIGSNQNISYPLNELGLVLVSGGPATGDRFYQNLVRFVQPQKKLMPSCYRISDGRKRFYPARNYPLPYVSGNNYEIDPDLGDEVINNTLENDNYKDGSNVYYGFSNPYRRMKQKEHIYDLPDIKPTIKEMTNNDGRRIDMFLDIAFDTNDDNTWYFDSNGNITYNHPYFFVRLRKTNGTNGFNLFEQAIDEGEMTIAMTSGHCAPCEFVIGVDKETQKNLVQINTSTGVLLRDADGNVRCGREGMQEESPQDEQNDTRNNEVWIALKKDITTYGEDALMPFNNGGSVQIRPSAVSSSSLDDGDTFVILHIEMPLAYVTAAEERLTREIIKQMNADNEEKFNFSLKYSKVYLGDNQPLVDLLNENVKVSVRHNGVTKQFFVSSYSYRMQASSPIPEINISGLVETVEELKLVASAGKGFMQKVGEHISENFAELMMGINRPFTRIINQNNTNVTNYIKGEFPADYVRTKDDLIFGSVVIGAGGNSVRRLPNGENGQVLKIINQIPTWGNAEAEALSVDVKKILSNFNITNNYTAITGLTFTCEEGGKFLIDAQIQISAEKGKDSAQKLVSAYLSTDEGKTAISSGEVDVQTCDQINIAAYVELEKESSVMVFIKCVTNGDVYANPSINGGFSNATMLKAIKIG